MRGAVVDQELRPIFGARDPRRGASVSRPGGARFRITILRRCCRPGNRRGAWLAATLLAADVCFNVRDGQAMLFHQVTNLCDDGGRLAFDESIGLRLKLCDLCLYLIERGHLFPLDLAMARTMPHSIDQALVSPLPRGRAGSPCACFPVSLKDTRTGLKIAKYQAGVSESEPASSTRPFPSASHDTTLRQRDLSGR